MKVAYLNGNMEKSMLKKLIFLTSALTCLSLDASASIDHSGHAYLKGNIGYGMQRTRREISGDTFVKQDTNSYIINAGYGYTFTNLMRADLELHYDDGKATKGGVRNEIKSIGGMLNGYIDINNQSQISPYLVGGVGYFTNVMRSVDTNSSGGTHNIRKTRHDMGYKLGIGALYAVDPMIDVDIAYNFILKHSANFALTNSLGASGDAKFNGMHALMLGVKFNY
jgi:opacity protein-like surface antigen